ncbi:hypothetical protein HXA31_15385 [Salipaludibacillus agaradhaerens]|uniref:Lipoprotein n=1 Tax=Salipaludibacillus agaradhaerens TaxID=76935 RepID=A0A9Q4FZF6_SALAG|nr:hypothetical protein [Salipaludibacillus agaradhaerens]MCR6098745.1 hypothetical protein [Salipaludibacillus agaradhaerens]MCR6115752.1 hypothetical protein [Salipaludibacillus agaradhaerens]
MKKLMMTLTIGTVLVGCGVNDDDGSGEGNEHNASTEENKPSAEEMADYNGLFQSDSSRDVLAEITLSPSENHQIPTVAIDEPFPEDEAEDYNHSEREIAKEYMDDNGRIYFPLKDHPFRNITSVDGTTTYLANYHDSFIHLLDAEAYVLDDDMIEEAYHFFITYSGDGDYRTWEEASNLERGIMQMIYLTAPNVNELGELLAQDIYAGDDFVQINHTFTNIGSPNMILPTAQTTTDMPLFEDMLKIHVLWGELGQFEQPEENKEAYTALYNDLHLKMTNMVGTINTTLAK